MATALEYIQVRAPEFASDPSLTTLISMATDETGDYGTEGMTSKAVALLVCHWLALKAREGGSGSGIAGALLSEKEGQLSRGYGSSGSAGIRSGDLGQTRWGLELLEHRRNRLFLPRTRMMD